MMTTTDTPAQTTVALPVGFRDPEYAQVIEWLWHESELLDNDRLDEWLLLLHPDVRYRLPVVETRHRADPSARVNYLFDETFSMLEARSRRIGEKTAWADDPPARVRRFVSNVRVRSTGPELHVSSYVLLVRQRWDNPGELFSGERRDEFVRTEDGELRLVRRDVLLDQSVITSHNLSVLF